MERKKKKKKRQIVCVYIQAQWHQFKYVLVRIVHARPFDYYQNIWELEQS